MRIEKRGYVLLGHLVVFLIYLGLHILLYDESRGYVLPAVFGIVLGIYTGTFVGRRWKFSLGIGLISILIETIFLLNVVSARTGGRNAFEWSIVQVPVAFAIGGFTMLLFGIGIHFLRESS